MMLPGSVVLPARILTTAVELKLDTRTRTSVKMAGKLPVVNFIARCSSTILLLIEFCVFLTRVSTVWA